MVFRACSFVKWDPLPWSPGHKTRFCSKRGQRASFWLECEAMVFIFKLASSSRMTFKFNDAWCLIPWGSLAHSSLRHARKGIITILHFSLAQGEVAVLRPKKRSRSLGHVLFKIGHMHIYPTKMPTGATCRGEEWTEETMAVMSWQLILLCQEPYVRVHGLNAGSSSLVHFSNAFICLLSCWRPNLGPTSGLGDTAEVQREHAKSECREARRST